MLHVGGSLGFSAVNMLGAMGSLPLFRFYRGDEFSHTIESAVAIPRTEALSWRFQSGLGANFHGFSGGLLSFGNTLTLGSAGWLDSVRADWTAPAPKSLLGIFYRWIASAAAGQRSWLGLSALLNAEYEQLRRESLELAFDKSDEYLRWVLSAGHESIVRIQGRLNVSVFAVLPLPSK